MPNHVTNRMRIRGPRVDIEALIAAHMRPKENGRHLDFDTVVAKPEDINPEASSTAEEGALLLTLLSLNPFSGLFVTAAPADLGVTVGWSEGALDRWREQLDRRTPDWRSAASAWLMSIAKYGHGSWYEWCCEHWGTKWNSYDSSDRWTNQPVYVTERTEFEILFNTAWSPPEPIFKRLSELWPSLEIEVLFFDEGENFAGHGAYQAGMGACERVPATREMYELVYGKPPDDEDEE